MQVLHSFVPKTCSAWNNLPRLHYSC